jgi:4-alpha-glucanotransferase
VVIGEDLGTVPAGVRRELHRRNVLSTRLALFERVPPSRYPRNAYAAITTHDLPTIAGLVSRADLTDQVAAGVAPEPDAIELLRGRLFSAAGLRVDGAPLDELVLALHRRLAASPSVLLAATLDDALLAERRPNQPGTYGDQRPNWSIPLPKPLEGIIGDPFVRRVTEALRR